DPCVFSRHSPVVDDEVAIPTWAPDARPLGPDHMHRVHPTSGKNPDMGNRLVQLGEADGGVILPLGLPCLNHFHEGTQNLQWAPWRLSRTFHDRTCSRSLAFACTVRIDTRSRTCAMYERRMGRKDAHG